MPDNNDKKREVTFCPWLPNEINNMAYIDDQPYVAGITIRFGECLKSKCEKYKGGSCAKV